MKIEFRSILQKSQLYIKWKLSLDVNFVLNVLNDYFDVRKKKNNRLS